MKIIIFSILFLAAFIFFGISISRIIKNLKIGTKKDSRTDNVFRRIKNVIVVAFLQSKLFRDFPAGMLHFLIFWGFILFIFAVLESFIQGFYPEFSFEILGSLFFLTTITQDVFSVLVILAVLYALYRRFIKKVPRLEVDKHGSADAVFILMMILVVCISMIFQNSFLLAKNNNTLAQFEFRPLTLFISQNLLGGVSSPEVFYELFWWIHIITIFVFMNYLPYSKHFHVISSVPNTYLANLEPHRNNIKAIDLEDESKDYYGASDIDQLSWKQLLDGYTCTECGRCTDACPASNVGKSLSPRKIIVDIRRRTEEKTNLLYKGITEGEVFDKTLLHNHVTDKELWQCTTCMSCVQECPVMIEHLDSIVDMRRYLVLTESEFPPLLNNVFRNIETNFTPWAFNQSDRANWAEGLNLKTMADDKDGEILFWVGCAGSFDERYKKVSRAFSQIMLKAGINFRILGNEEKCNGDAARRLGNEYLAQMMIKENIETLNGYNVKKIVTMCPHCFQSLGREYKQFGGDYEVIHHSDFILNLLNEGKIKVKQGSETEKIIYHDSCYLGRYNNIYDSPRELIKSNASIELLEADRNKSKGFCCGAGGGRMFLEDEEGGRINIERTRELLTKNPDKIASACPFCMTMLNDGLKHFEKTESTEVKDIAEIIFENLT